MIDNVVLSGWVRFVVGINHLSGQLDSRGKLRLFEGSVVVIFPLLSRKIIDMDLFDFPTRITSSSIDL